MLVRGLTTLLSVSLAISLSQKNVHADAATLIEHNIEYGDKKRSYLLYVPRSYTGQPAPLILAFHGGGGRARSMANTSQFHQLADREGFLVVYPNGTGGFFGRHLSWNAGSNPPVGSAEINREDDVGFIRNLLDRLNSQYGIDQQRIFAVGMSKGGMFAYKLACELSDRIAGIVVVAGTMTTDHCKPTQEVALLHIHGDSDENVPLSGGKGKYTAKKAYYPAMMYGLEIWQENNGCSSQVLERRLTTDTRCYDYAGCPAGGAVSYCIISGGGHAWPGAEPKNWQKRRNVFVSQSFSATLQAWEFLIGIKGQHNNSDQTHLDSRSEHTTHTSSIYLKSTDSNPG